MPTDRDGRFLFVNSSFAQRFGCAAGDMIGQTADRVARRCRNPAALERHRQIIDGERRPDRGSRKFRCRAAEPAGAHQPCPVARRRWPIVDRRVAALDITDRKEAELALIAAKEEAELASRSKTEFLANMSHELRTPLNAIIGFSQLMADEVMGPLGSARYTSYARDICASGQHLLSIIGDILDVSKLEAGRIELDEEEVEVPQMIRDLLHLVVERARSLEIGIDLEVPPDLPRIQRRFAQAQTGAAQSDHQRD